MKRIWTIGHSTRPIEDFIAALKASEIKLVADVRLLPGSRRHPQFNQESLIDSLGKADIRYEHFPELGGRRKPKPDSRNTAWRNDAFRGYADYMETREFGNGIERLLNSRRRNWRDRHHVRGSGLVALSSLACFRFSEGSRLRGHPHP